jgi:hypothetical protein
MTEALPEVRGLPAGLVLDGELVAFNKAGDPHFPLAEINSSSSGLTGRPG